MANECEALLEKWKIIHADNRQSKTPPEFLYHYTDVHGLHGIAFNPRELWLSDFRSTNDPTEGRHALMLLEQGIKEYLPVTATSALSHVFHAPLGEWNELFRIMDSLDRRFFTSFSESENELSQWVHYGAHGAGYCIGMRSESLLKQTITLEEHTLTPRLIPVEYSKDVQEATTNQFLKEIAGCYTKHQPILCIHERAISVMYQCFENLLRWFARAYALEFKNSHFSSEREWRYVVEFSPVDWNMTIPMKTRVKSTGIMWYIPIACIPQSIKAGPRVDYEQFRAACAPLLLGTLNGIPLSQSDIPLR